ncbi:hypothetical protein E6C67_08265 [Azospirillum sp. TSA2s]|uniref:hypothetical protein n=1 Tax=Azospirillum sp. TSA2s TaxID=709810 RepID=UPI0010A9DF5C|nr:hypothetical protein [Azospirillum sp. TSA2s]QCG93933.1 hypothetical protein E6C67_08265 [Azospirillum sp. TSA2s]
MTTTQRVVVWFSCGAASAVAAKLALAKYRDTHEVVIARIVVSDEHPDGERFAADCARWFAHPVINLRSDEYGSCEEVFAAKRYMSGVAGATCTGALKKAPRYEFQRPNDIQVFGFTEEERRRAKRFREQNFDVILETPLISSGLSKNDCHALIERAGIERHAMYKMGFPNANCRGCVKSKGAGYWNLTRQWFPDYFESRARQSREIGCRLVELNGKRIFLDELPEGVGNISEEQDFECSILCAIAEQDMAA